jgi:hypothetical protein
VERCQLGRDQQAVSGVSEEIGDKNHVARTLLSALHLLASRG